MTDAWKAIEYVLDPGDEGDDESYMWGVTVAWQGPGDLWGVYRGCYVYPRHFGFSTSGALEMEPTRGERDDEWRATHRLPLTEAMALGERVLPTIVINGMTWAMVCAWRGAGCPRDENHRPIMEAK